MIAPCKDCGSREIGCHAKCEKYLAFAEEREAINHEKNILMKTTEFSKSYRKNLAYLSAKRSRGKYL